MWCRNQKDAGIVSGRHCALADVRGPSGTWAFDGCVHIDLSMPNTHWADPFNKPPGLRSVDVVKLAPLLANTNVTHLRLAGLAGIHHTHEQPGFEATGMIALAAVLSARLEVLEIPGNAIGDKGVTALAEALLARPPGVPPLCLNLEVNSIGDTGAIALARAIRVGKVQQLNLNHNWVGAEGGEALASALAVGRSQGGPGSALRVLSLAGNNVAERGAAAFAAALQSSSELRTLNLYSNHIGTEGALALAPVLAGTSLAELDLSYNYIDANGEDAAARALVAALRGGTSLRKLDLRWNHFHDCRCGAPMRLRRAAVRQSGLELLLERRSEAEEAE